MRGVCAIHLWRGCFVSPNDKSDTPFLPQHVATFDLNWDLMFIQDPFSDVSPT